jgi:hypothetical protein
MFMGYSAKDTYEILEEWEKLTEEQLKDLGFIEFSQVSQAH